MKNESKKYTETHIMIAFCLGIFFIILCHAIWNIQSSNNELPTYPKNSFIHEEDDAIRPTDPSDTLSTGDSLPDPSLLIHNPLEF